MTQLANQVFLPLCLALIMLVMGTGLSISSFKPLIQAPKAAFIGLAAQLLLLPLLVWLLIIVLRLPTVLAAGLVLLACAPGGATSNLFSHLGKGDLALSVALTAMVSLLAPLWMPWVASTQLGWLGYEASFGLSYRVTVMQLAMVTVMPLLMGMLLRRLASNWVTAQEGKLKLLATGLLLTMIVILLIVNQRALPSLLSYSALVVMLLASLALLAGYALGRVSKLSPAQARTLSFETGVQNAATAMMVAFSFLAAPELAMIALLYGVLMNVPAFAALWWMRERSVDAAGSALSR